MEIKFFSIGIILCFLGLVVELVRRDKLTFKYAVGWMSLSFLAVLCVLFDRIIINIAYGFGFILPSNFIFFVLLCFFVFLSLLLTTFICQQDKNNDTIAQKLGILEMEVNDLKKKEKL